MNIEIAKSAGFCFGVKRALDMIEDLLKKGDKICTLGEIIHNKNMIKELQNKGVRVINSVNEAEVDEVIVIRSHGIGKTIYNDLEGKRFVDCTCPFVSKIHNIVSGEFRSTETGEILNSNDVLVIIIGDLDHPEVQGIKGHCEYEYKIIADLDELKDNCKNINGKHCKIVVQTTYNSIEWLKCVEFIRKSCTNYEIFDTICNETEKRQSEARSMAQEKDLMIIVGDRCSSNTQKLVGVCSKYSRTILVEDQTELELDNATEFGLVGITAGASTPAHIIKEVRVKMDELMKNEESFNFADELEKSMKHISTGSRVVGTIIGVGDLEAQVDIGTKQAAYLPIDEITDDPTLKISDVLNIGDEVNLIVMRVNDVDGIITLSKKKFDAIGGYEKLEKAFMANEILHGKVIQVLKDGVIVACGGGKIFVHRSQTGLEQNEPMETMINKSVLVKVTRLDSKRRSAKGSIREAQRENFWANVKVGDFYKGPVKSLTNFGAFVGLGGEDGLIFISDLSWNRIKHPSEVLKIGDVVEVYVKDLDTEKRRVSLGYKNVEENPWKMIEEKYSVGDIVKTKIASITPFGAFAEVLPGAEGLIHVSQISKDFVKTPQDALQVGQEVEAKIVDMDLSKKRISLSIKDAIEDKEMAKQQEE